MKKILALFFVFAVALAIFSACEKDDICPKDTLTTPLLNIGFYDFNNQDTFKAVASLRIIGIDSITGFTDTLNTFTDRSSQTKISIPLNTASNSSKFLFITDSDSDNAGKETGNIDTLQFNYARQERFISRGCGYGTIFTDLTTLLNPAYDNSNPKSEKWIISILDQDKNLEHQDTIHVKIYH